MQQNHVRYRTYLLTISVEELNDGIRSARPISTTRLVYKMVKSEAVNPRYYADASLASMDDLTSQNRFLRMRCTNKRRYNLLDYQNREFCRLVRPAMVAEVYAFAEPFNNSHLIRSAFKQTHSRQ